jgi:two-component system, chemotaxis family, chemotaxis protein CheY
MMSAGEFLADLVPPDPEDKLKERRLDVNRFAAQAFARQFSPGEVFQPADASMLVRVCLNRHVGCTRHGRSRMLALVVDDSRTVRLIVGNILREMGLEVLEAENGLVALEQMRLAPDVELILVDWNMPEMDGFTFIQSVRSQRRYDAVRILMVTTETDREQVAKVLRAGANEYLMKPFTKEVLIAKLGMLDVYMEQ